MKRLASCFAVLALSIGAVSLSTHCGGGGGGSGDGSSRIAGNVSSVSSASLRGTPAAWLIRVAREAVGFARKAYAQATGLDEVEVFAGRGSDLTDEDGEFDVDAPTGDVTVTFRKGDCEAEVDLPDVADGAAVTLEDVAFDCDSAHPNKVAESFEAIVRTKPGSPNGNLNVCIDLGSGFRTRVVKIKNATFVGGTFQVLQVGDRIEVDGVREGQGAPSALDAETVTLLGPSAGDPCSGAVATETPDDDETPEPTETPEGTETPEPTETPEATPNT